VPIPDVPLAALHPEELILDGGRTILVDTTMATDIAAVSAAHDTDPTARPCPGHCSDSG
jgi:hypothetical protein